MPRLHGRPCRVERTAVLADAAACAARRVTGTVTSTIRGPNICFDLSVDPGEKAELARTIRMSSTGFGTKYLAWNATMLPKPARALCLFPTDRRRATHKWARDIAI